MNETVTRDRREWEEMEAERDKLLEDRRRLIEALKEAEETIAGEFCSHDGQCGANVKGCYTASIHALLTELESK